MKKVLYVLSFLLTIGVIDASAQSSPPLSPKRIRLQGQAAPPTPNPPTGYYNIWVDSATGALNITNSAGTDTPIGADYSALTTGLIPQMGASALANSKMTTSGTNSGTWTLYDSTASTGASQLFVRTGPGQSTTNQLLIGSTSTGLFESAAGILAVTDGSTGQGGIGISDAATNTVTDALILRHATSGTAAASFGTGLLFQGEDAAGNMQSMAQIQAVYTDSANASEDADLKLYGVLAGTLTNIFNVVPTAGLVPATDNTYDIGTSSARVKTGYFVNVINSVSVISPSFAGESSGHLGILLNGGSATMSIGDTGSFPGSVGGGLINLSRNPTNQIEMTAPLSVTHIQGTRTQAISDAAAAATFVTIAAATSNTVVGGRIFYTITAIDAGTGSHVKTGTYSFGLNNVGGTVTGTGTDVLEHSAASPSGGTLAPTFSINISGTNAQFQLVLDTSLDAAAETLKIEYRVQIDSGTATVTPAT